MYYSTISNYFSKNVVLYCNGNSYTGELKPYKKQINDPDCAETIYVVLSMNTNFVSDAVFDVNEIIGIAEFIWTGK